MNTMKIPISIMRMTTVSMKKMEPMIIIQIIPFLPIDMKQITVRKFNSFVHEYLYTQKGNRNNKKNNKEPTSHVGLLNISKIISLNLSQPKWPPAHSAQLTSETSAQLQPPEQHEYSRRARRITATKMHFNTVSR